MPENDDQLRALIRLLPPVRTLKEHCEQMIHLEMYSGVGDAAIKNFQGLQSSVAAIVNDPYLQTLIIDAPPEATDKQKLTLVLLAVGQLAAFMEGQTGLVALSGAGKGGGNNYQTAPNININISGIPPENLEKIIDIAENAAKKREE